MSNKIYDYAILGGGLYGMNIAKLLKNKFPSANIALIEKKKRTFFDKNNQFYIATESNYMYPPQLKKYSLIKEGSKKIEKFCLENEIKYNKVDNLVLAFKELEKKRMEEILQNDEKNKIDEISSEEALVLEPLIKNEKAIDGYDIYNTGESYILDYYKVCKTLYKNLQSEKANLDLIFDCNINKISETGETYKINTTSSNSAKKEISSKFVINCLGTESLNFAHQLNLMKNYSSGVFLLNYFTNDLNLKYPSNLISSPGFLVHPGISLHKFDKTLTIGPTITLNKLESSFLQKLKSTMQWLNIHKIYHKTNRDPTMDYFYNNKTQIGLFFYNLYGLNFFKFTNDSKHSFEHNIIYSQKEDKLVEDFIFLKEKNSIHLINFNFHGGFTSFIPASEEVIKML